MSDDDDRTLGTERNGGGWRRFLRSGWLWALPPALLLGAAFVTAPAVSSAGVGHFGKARGFGGGHDPERVRAHTERAADWILALVDASDAQREDVLSVVGRTIDALQPLAEEHRATKGQWLAALSAPSVDPAELERLRVAELALAEQASGELVAGLADVAAVLTPEQRAKLADLAARFHDHD